MSAVALQGAPLSSACDGAGQENHPWEPPQGRWGTSTGSSWLPTRLSMFSASPSEAALWRECGFHNSFLLYCVYLSVCLSGVEYIWKRLKKCIPGSLVRTYLLPSWYLPEARAHPPGGNADLLDGDVEVCGYWKVNKIFEIQGHLLLEGWEQEDCWDSLIPETSIWG